MADKPKDKPTFQCPVPKEHRETIKEIADIVEKHKQIAKKLSPL